MSHESCIWASLTPTGPLLQEVAENRNSIHFDRQLPVLHFLFIGVGIVVLLSVLPSIIYGGRQHVEVQGSAITMAQRHVGTIAARRLPQLVRTCMQPLVWSPAYTIAKHVCDNSARIGQSMHLAILDSIWSGSLSEELKEIRGPWGLPVVGNALLFIRPGGLAAVSLDLSRRYGSIANANNFGQQYFFLNDPELVKQVTVTQSQAFYNRPVNRKRISSNETGFFASPQVNHVRYRALVNPFFNNPWLMEKHTSIVERETLAATAAWKSNSQVDIQPVFKEVSLNVMGKITYTEIDTQGFRDLLDAMKEVPREGWMAAIFRRVVTSPPFSLAKIPMMDAARQHWLEVSNQLRAVEMQIISARREQLKVSHKVPGSEVGTQTTAFKLPDDLLSMLISFNENEMHRLTDGVIQKILRDIMVAGADTTALSIIATLGLLARDPFRQLRVMNELDQVIGTDPSRKITYVDVNRLAYLRLCIQEAVRLYPSGDVIIRKAGETANVGGYQIPEGSVVIATSFSLGRNKEQWGADADAFRPERFEELDATGQRRFPKHRFAWLPFGAGPHSCLGSQLALMEATVACATVFRQWQLSVTDRVPLIPGRVVSVNLVPRQPVL